MNTVSYLKNREKSKNVFRRMSSIVYSQGDNYHKAHFGERCFLCNLSDESYKKYIRLEDIDAIKKAIIEERYRDVVDNFIIDTYKDSPGKELQYKFFSELKDDKILKYLAIGVLCERIFIAQRNNLSYNFQYIKDIDVEEMFKFALTDDILIKESPTYFINSIMYLWNVLGRPEAINTSKIIERFTSQPLPASSEELYKYMYGITHLVIQLSGFYRVVVHNSELKQIILNFLEEHSLDFNLYIDIYTEASLCYKLLGGTTYNDWLLKKYLDEDGVRFFDNISIKNEHSCVLYIMLFNLHI